MQAETTDRGFRKITHPEYSSAEEDARLLQESSAAGEYPDSMEKPGSSYLWVGDRHHLNREEIQQMIEQMQHWLDTGRLPE